VPKRQNELYNDPVVVNNYGHPLYISAQRRTVHTLGTFWQAPVPIINSGVKSRTSKRLKLDNLSSLQSVEPIDTLLFPKNEALTESLSKR
jgi:hypothetical protein